MPIEQYLQPFTYRVGCFGKWRNWDKCLVCTIEKQCKEHSK